MPVHLESKVYIHGFPGLFYRYADAVHLPAKSFDGIEEGDVVEIDFDEGMIYNRTKNTSFKGQAFPPFMQEIISKEGLINYINSKE